MKTEEILNEREKTHGDFEDVAILAYDLEKPIYDYLIELKGKGLDKQFDKKRILAIKMIMLKIARIVCGDEDHADHWDDIAGYAMLGKGKEEECEHEWSTIPICKKCGAILYGFANP